MIETRLAMAVAELVVLAAVIGAMFSYVESQ
jgi:hypothetical protein